MPCILNNQKPNTLKIDDLRINNSLSENLLSITFDFKLRFNKHIKDICRKASQKLNALASLALRAGEVSENKGTKL